MTREEYPGAGEYPGRTKYDRARAETYSRRSPRRNREEAKVLARILSAMPAGGDVLDAPCGAGRIARILLDRGDRVVAGDLSGEMLRKAGEDLGRGPRFIRCDLARLPFRDGSFDRSFSIRLFHHIPSAAVRSNMLRELARVTREEVVVTFFHPVSLHNATRWIERLLLGRKSPRVCFTARRLARDAATAGLTLERTCAVRRYLKDLWFAVLAKAGSPAGR
jgi:ubiquinone/menaquinone biosynthesis C-methylase UbiE